MISVPRVLNKYKLLPGEGGIDISRRGPWGNPWPARGPSDRARVCDLFERYVQTWPKALVVEAIHTLRGSHLVCSCHPLRCHGDTLLRLANDPAYLSTHYPPIQKLPRAIHVQDTPTIVHDLRQLQELNPEVVNAYALTAPKVIKDHKLLAQTKYHYILKRYCTQLSIFNTTLEDDESTCSHYYHQTYFGASMAEIAQLESCHFKYNDLLELHVASLLFFNTLATLAAQHAVIALKKNATALDKYHPPEFHEVKIDLIAKDKVLLPGTQTSVLSFLKHYRDLLEL